MSINLFELSDKELIDYARKIYAGDDERLSMCVTVLCMRLEAANKTLDKLTISSAALEAFKS